MFSSMQVGWAELTAAQYVAAGRGGSSGMASSSGYRSFDGETRGRSDKDVEDFETGEYLKGSLRSLYGLLRLELV